MVLHSPGYPRLLSFVVGLLLTPALASAQIFNGTVREASSGAALGSMVVAAYTSAGVLQSNVTTDFNGSYVLAVPAGAYRVLAYDPTGIYATEFANAADSYENSPLTNLGIGGTATFNFALRLGVAITGGVTANGLAVGNVVVAAYNVSGSRRGFAVTGFNGEFSIVVPPGTYKFVAYDDGGFFGPVFYPGKVAFADADALQIIQHQPRRVGFNLSAAARLAGTVSDPSGAPLGQMLVMAYTLEGAQAGSTTTDASGRFALSLAAGTYRLAAADPGGTYPTAFYGGADSFGTTAAMVLGPGEMKSSLLLAMKTGGRITGKTIDAASGAPVAGITIAAYNLDGTPYTTSVSSASGDFTLVLPVRDFKLVAYDTSLTYATQFHPQEQLFDEAAAIRPVVAQTSTIAPFSLSRGARISGLISNEGGAPVAGVTVEAYDLRGNLAGSATSGSDGRYLFILSAASYRFLAWDGQLRYAPAYDGGAAAYESTTPREVTATATVVDLTVRRATVVSGSVRDASGKALAGHEVQALDAARNRVAKARTREDGSFQLALAAGNYKFVASDPEGFLRRSFFGGSDFATATTVTVGSTSPAPLSFVLEFSPRRRATGRR